MSHPSLPALRQLLSAHRPRRSSDGYPTHVRLSVATVAAELRAAGWSDTRLGRELGVAATTVALWLRRPAPSSFRPVEVVDDALHHAPATLTLVTPHGYRLEGLDLGAATALLARLG